MKNKRRDFLKLTGLAGAASIIPFGKMFAQLNGINKPTNCALIPSETAGPFPLDLSSNPDMFRTDIREEEEGADTLLKMHIMGVNNCLPMANCRVDLWHCNAHGYYSGFITAGQLGTQDHTGETFLRGIQMTDANGDVQFLTKFPGCYPGRVAHMHFQIFVSSVLQVTSQLTFPEAEKNEIYTTVEPYIAYGADPVSIAFDGVFVDGYSLQLTSLTYNNYTAQYEASLDVTIDGTGATGLQQLEPETGGQFKLGQNFPNPFSGETTIPFTLKQTSDVKIELWNVAGKKVATLEKKAMAKGDHEIVVNMKSLGIPTLSYVYQLEVTNRDGSFRQCKMMTAAK